MVLLGRDVKGVAVIGLIIGLVGAALTAPAEDVLILVLIGCIVVGVCRARK